MIVADSRGRLSLRRKRPYENQPKGKSFSVYLRFVGALQAAHDVMIAGDEEGVREEPCDGAGKADGDEAEGGSQHHGNEDSCHHFKKSCHDRDLGEAEPLHGEAIGVQNRDQDVEIAGDPQIRCGVGDDLVSDRCLCAIDKERSEAAAEEKEHDEGKCRKCCSDQQEGAHALTNAIKSCRTKVLSRVGCRGGAEGIHRNVQQMVDLVACGDRRYVSRAEAVDRSLQDDAADGGDGILKTHGDADATKTLDVMAAGKHLTLLHLQNVKFACHIEKAKES